MINLLQAQAPRKLTQAEQQNKDIIKQKMEALNKDTYKNIRKIIKLSAIEMELKDPATPDTDKCKLMQILNNL